MADWEDRPWGNLAEEYPEQMYYFSNDPEKWSIPGGEPYWDVAERIRAFVLEAAERYEGKTVVCVTHGLAVRALLCRLFGIPSNELYRLHYGDNTSVTQLSVENGEITVDWYNDASHLERAGLSTFSRQGWRKPNEKTAADPHLNAALYQSCYERTWLSSHSDLRGFSPIVYQRSAERLFERDENTVMRLDFGGRFAGIITVDPERGAEVGAGWISLIWIEPEMRGMRLGVQLLGHAVSYFRKKGRRAIRLHVADTNLNAVGFYESVGFRRIGTAQGAVGTLYLMEWDISPKIICPEEI